VAVTLAFACNLDQTAPAPGVELDPLPTFAVAGAAGKGGSWETRARIPSGRVNMGAGVIPNVRGETVFYAVGGQSLNGAITNVVQAYNPISNTWAIKAPLPVRRVFANGTGVINGKLYLPGGYDRADQSGLLGITQRQLFVYDAATNAWSQKKMMPVSSAAGVSGVIAGRLYVLTGVKHECQDCPTITPRSLYRYDPASDTWNRLASAPNPHVGGVGGVINGKFYVAGGGAEFEGPTTRHLDVYDPATNTWTSKAPMPTTRDPGAAGAVVGERLYLTGAGTSIVEAYEPATDKWTRQADAPDPARWDQGAGTIRNDRGDEQMIVVGAPPEEPNGGPGDTWVHTPYQQKMAFTTNRDGNFEIYLMRADGRLQKNLSNNPGGSDFGQAWSPSGNKIAFQSDRAGNPEIYTMSVNGLDQVNLTNNRALDAAPRWSPDGGRIAFHSNRAGSFDIFVMRKDGTGQTRLTSAAGNDFNPRWSSDGTRIAFERTAEEPDSHTDIYVINANGTGETNLTNSPDANDNWPRWSADGRKIAFIHGGPEGGLDIYVMNADGTGKTNVSGNPAGFDQAPEWSPDGRRIAFERNGDIWVVNADGSNQIQLTNNSATEFIPHWSPDGSRIAFTRSVDASNTEIYVMWPDGSAQKNVTRRPSGEAEPAWLP
jgi:Tol biopolymer transport system component/N-acetylneuraminic acid mutarotase